MPLRHVLICVKESSCTSIKWWVEEPCMAYLSHTNCLSCPHFFEVPEERTLAFLACIALLPLRSLLQIINVKIVNLNIKICTTLRVYRSVCSQRPALSTMTQPKTTNNILQQCKTHCVPGISICKRHYYWKISKSMRNLWRAPRPTAGATEVMASAPCM